MSLVHFYAKITMFYNAQKRHLFSVRFYFNERGDTVGLFAVISYMISSKYRKKKGYKK